jgi:hypothetical protein
MMRCLIALVAMMAASPVLASSLSYDVIRTSDKSFTANIVFLKGEKKTILIDAPYRKSLDTLIALKPEIVVAGHDRPGLPHDASALSFTKAYLDAWPVLAKKARNAAELVRLIKKAFPDAIDPNGDFSLNTSARVTLGEEPKWHE